MWYYVKFMKLIAYIIHSKMILQVMLKGEKMATSHLTLKDHLTKIHCTNMIKDICITFKVAHIIQVRDLSPFCLLPFIYALCSFYIFSFFNYQANTVKIQCVTSVVESEKNINMFIPSIGSSTLCFVLLSKRQFFNSLDRFPPRMLLTNQINYYIIN